MLRLLREILLVARGVTLGELGQRMMRESTEWAENVPSREFRESRDSVALPKLRSPTGID